MNHISTFFAVLAVWAAWQEGLMSDNERDYQFWKIKWVAV